MRCLLITLIAVILSLPLRCTAEEKFNKSDLKPGDWLQADRINYATASINAQSNSALAADIAPHPDNTFYAAFDYNLSKKRAAEYKTVAQRNSFYDYASFRISTLDPSKKGLSEIRFFVATTLVTGWGAIGAVESDAMKNLQAANQAFAPLQKYLGKVDFLPETADLREAIKLLTKINERLFKTNLPVIAMITSTWTTPRQPNGKSLDVISPLEFDLSMVELEQSNVQAVLDEGKPRASVIKVVNFLQQLKGALPPWGLLDSGKHVVDVAGDWAREAGFAGGAFESKSERVAIGRAIVFRLHTTDLFQGDERAAKQAYLAYMKTHALPKAATGRAVHQLGEPWVAATATVMNDADGKLVEVLYGQAVRHVLSVPKSLRPALVKDYVRLLNKATQVKNSDDQREFMKDKSISKYGLTNILSPLNLGDSNASQPGVDNLLRANAVDTEQLYNENIIQRQSLSMAQTLVLANTIPAARDVVNQINEKVFSIPRSVTWADFRTSSALQKNQEMAKLAEDVVRGGDVRQLFGERIARQKQEAVDTVANAVNKYQDAIAKTEGTVQTIHTQVDSVKSNMSELLNGSMDAHSLKARAAAVQSIALLFGAEDIARDAGDAVKIVDAAIKISDAVTILAMSSTGVGAFMAVGSIASVMGGLGGGGNPNAEVLKQLERLFDYLKQQFSVINQKLDNIISRLEDIRTDLVRIETKIDQVNGKLDTILVSMGHMERTLEEINSSLLSMAMQARWDTVQRCLGYSRDKVSFNADNTQALSECTTAYLNLLDLAVDPKNTFSLPMSDLTFDERIGDAVGPTSASLDPNRSLKYLDALSRGQAQILHLAPPTGTASGALNAAFVWHTISGLAVLKQDYANVFTFQPEVVRQIREAKSLVDKADRLTEALVGKSPEAKRTIFTSLLGKLSSNQSADDAVMVHDGTSSTDSYAGVLVEMNQLMEIARTQAIEQYVDSDQRSKDTLFLLLQSNCDSRTFAWTFRSKPVTALDNFFTSAVPYAAPPFYLSQGGQLNTQGISNWFTMGGGPGSMGGPIELCIERADKKQHFAFPLPAQQVELTATMQIKFAGVNLPNIQFRAFYKTGMIDSRRAEDLVVRTLMGVPPDPTTVDNTISCYELPCVLPADARNNFLREFNRVLSENADQARKGLIQAVWSQIETERSTTMSLRDAYAFCQQEKGENCGAPPPARGYWRVGFQYASPRALFLQVFAKNYQDPTNNVSKAIMRKSKQLGMTASMLRLQASVSMPDFISLVDPLRILLIGSPNGRLLDNTLLQDILSCIETIDNPTADCDPQVSNLIEDGVIEQSLLPFAARVQSMHELIGALPWHEAPNGRRFNSGNVYVDTLKARFDALVLDSPSSTVSTEP